MMEELLYTAHVILIMIISTLLNILQKNVNVMLNQRIIKGRTPLYWASYHGYLDVVKYLTEECHAEITDRIISDAKNSEIRDYLRRKK